MTDPARADPAPADHAYTGRVAWSGSTGVGYDGYDRRHTAVLPSGGMTLPLSADAAFRGDPACPNPEQLLVLAAASCQLLSFLAVAARARLDVLHYTDDATGQMPATDRYPSLREIVLRPRITVRGPATPERVLRLCEVAHRECYIANSVRTPIVVQPSIRLVPPA